MPHIANVQRAFILMIICLLSSCATSNRITQDFKPDTDFRSYKTYSWHNFSSDISHTDQLAIQHAVEQQLTQKGFTKVTTNPDLVLDLNIIKQRNQSSGGGVGISLGLPVGRHGSIGLGTQKLLEGDNVVGLIILDITAQQTSQVIWRGSAEAVPLNYFTLRNQAQLSKVIADLVNQFPPK